ncbi:hypothetical protein ABT215_44575 [Streptomyces sp900105755]|uniref:hypothetical protein n=1 Tax=Streptomyces sp. 900105755 TaxID=3154389 RepID=UPI00331B957B
MRFLRNAKRVGITAAVTCTMATGLLASTAGSASASTIKNEWIQLCAQGNYPAYVEFPYRGGASSFVVSPGQCQWWNWQSIGIWEPVNVVDSWSGKIIGTEWYNGDYNGLGIGALGSEGGQQRIQTW